VAVAERVVLHIGSMKSGTSFIQNVLGHNKDALAEQGVLFAGPRWKFQVKAVQDLIGRGGPEQEPLDPAGPWRTLVGEIDAWSGTAVVSMEFLGPRSAEKVAQIRESFPNSTVEAVLTCRDLARNIPAMWLESTQNGSVTGWADYLEAVRTEDRRTPAGRNFWRHQAIPAMARRWSEGLDGRLTLVTVPQKGAPPGLLWERFAEVVGVRPAGVDLDVRANPSIGLATALVLLDLNRKLRQPDGELPRHYDMYVKHHLAKRGLVARQGDEPRLGLDADWVRKRGEQQVKRLRADGHRVVGDLDELRPRSVPGVHADEVSAEERLAAAVDGLEQMFRNWSRSERQLRRRVRRLTREAGA
jgi:hypothetical protein